MPSVDLEADVALDDAQERLQFGRRQLDHALAPLADQVLVILVGQVVDGAAVTEMHVVDHAGFLQGVERPVHRGDVHRRKAPLHTPDDVVGRYMTARP
jgi:hypothetical protein